MPVSLLLVVVVSYRLCLTIFITELAGIKHPSLSARERVSDGRGRQFWGVVKLFLRAIAAYKHNYWLRH